MLEAEGSSQLSDVPFCTLSLSLYCLLYVLRYFPKSASFSITCLARLSGVIEVVEVQLEGRSRSEHPGSLKCSH
jgi:hypothetical protein